MIFTQEMKQRLESYLDTHQLSVGVLSKGEVCSIAAINLVISGELTDDIPDCVSLVIGQWVITIQDSMPDAMRNSCRWKRALVLLAGSGRDKEALRLEIILTWLWTVVLPSLQSYADAQGFGKEWKEMTDTRTDVAAVATLAAVEIARAVPQVMATAIATAIVASVVRMVKTVILAEATTGAAWAAAAAANTVVEAEMATEATWDKIDPVTLLERLVEI